MKIAIRRIALSLVSFAASILIAEICLEVFAPVPDPYQQLKIIQAQNQYIRSEFLPDSHFLTEPEEGLRGVGPHNIFSTNNMGFRGDYLTSPKPVNEFRVFMVGGSTTECFYLDDAKAVSRILQDELSRRGPPGITVKVFGAGKSGDASDDHVSMIVHRIVHLEPDMIVVFSGVNDLSRSIYNYDYLHYEQTVAGRDSHLPLVRLLATEYQIPRRLYYLKTHFFPSERQIREQVTLRSGIQEKRRLGESLPFSDNRPPTNAKAYANNLRTILGAAQANNIQLVFMTQQSTWHSTVDPETRNWQAMLYRNGVKYREDLMDQALEILNEEMRALAKEHSVPIYDLAKTMPKSLEFFYDDVHFNENGARVTATRLAGLVEEKHLIKLRVAEK